MEAKVAAIIGVGPGLGRALALRFARGGLSVGLLARSEEPLRALQSEVEAAGAKARSYPCDAASEESVRAAFARLKGELGAPEVLVYNAGAFQMGGVLELAAADLERSWRIGCLGALLASQAVLPAMLERGRGTLLFTGATASLRGAAGFAALAVGKFGLRALAQSMARELGPRGIHVAHVVIDGGIDTPRVRGMLPSRDPATLLPTAGLAEAYWNLYAQEGAWTQELDLRTPVEKF